MCLFIFCPYAFKLRAEGLKILTTAKGSEGRMFAEIGLQSCRDQPFRRITGMVLHPSEKNGGIGNAPLLPVLQDGITHAFGKRLHRLFPLLRFQLQKRDAPINLRDFSVRMAEIAVFIEDAVKGNAFLKKTNPLVSGKRRVFREQYQQTAQLVDFGIDRNRSEIDPLLPAADFRKQGVSPVHIRRP